MERKTLKKIKRSHLLPALAILAFYSLFMVVSACDSSTSPKTGTLTGRVELVNDTGNPELDPVDFSGVKVSLYELAEVDSIVQNAKSVFGSGGFPVNQNSEFDHRMYNDVVHTISLSDGTFTLSKIPYGMYNLVIDKEGWGYRYVYDLEVNESEISYINARKRNDLLELYPEMVVSGAVDGIVEISSWHHLVTSGDVTFLPSSSLTIGANGFVRIEPGKKVDVMGQFEAGGSAENLFRITSDYSNHDYQARSLRAVEYLSFNLGASTQTSDSGISWGVFGPAQVALAISNADNLLLEKSKLISNNDGFLVTVCDGVSVRECLFSGTSDLNNGLHLYMVDSGILTGNIFVGSRAGTLLEEYCAQEIEDNVFIGNEYGIEMFNCDPNVRFNYFRINEYGIRLTGPISPIIEYNYIDSDTSIIIGYNGYYPNAIPNIHNNNMIAENHFLYLSKANYIDIEAQNNYYYTSNIMDIEQKIYDKYDYPEDLQPQVSQILFKPIRTSKISGAKPRI